MKSKALDKAVGQIKRVLAQKQMGEKDLATAMSVTEGDVSQLLAGSRKLEFDNLENIAAALGVSVESLFKEQDEGEFADQIRDPRLTDSENAFLVERLWEIREAFIELLLKKRLKSHDRDFVAG